MTEKERAVLENEVWLLRPPGARDRDKWVSTILEVDSSAVGRRARIIGAGDAANPLWERVEGELTVSGAVELIVRARRVAYERTIPLKDAVEDVVQEYESWPVTRFIANNKVVRQPPKTTGRPARRVVRDMAEEEVPPVDVKAVVEEKNFWSSIRKQFAEYAEKRLAGFDGIEKADIKRSFENELRTVLESLRVKIHLRASRRKTRISFAEVIEACDVLVMEPPSRGRLPDMTLAKKRKHALAKEYHPDHSGTNMTRDNLNSVLEAYELLDSYCTQMALSAAQGLKTEGTNDHGDSDE